MSVVSNAWGSKYFAGCNPNNKSCDDKNYSKYQFYTTLFGSIAGLVGSHPNISFFFFSENEM